MNRTPIATLAALAGAIALFAAPGPSPASVAGVCPDGSLFVVSSTRDVPCARAKLVDDPSDLPPIRPELLPQSHTWDLDQRGKSPNNPYNLLDRANAVRGRNAPPEPTTGETASGASEAPPTAQRPAPLRLLLGPDEMRDLVRLVSLRQELAPATFTIEDIAKREELLIRLAHSAAFEERVRGVLGRDDRHVILFQARSVKATEFRPNFFLVADGATFRPDPESPHEIGWIVGEPGEMAAGKLALGYLVVPKRFDPGAPLEIWWNDRSLETVLAPS